MTRCKCLSEHGYSLISQPEEVDRLSFAVRLPEVHLGGQQVRLQVVLPYGYPEEAAHVSVSALGASRKQHEALEGVVAAAAKEQADEGCEAAMVIVAAAVEESTRLAEEVALSSSPYLSCLLKGSCVVTNTHDWFLDRSARNWRTKGVGKLLRQRARPERGRPSSSKDVSFGFTIS